MSPKSKCGSILESPKTTRHTIPRYLARVDELDDPFPSVLTPIPDEPIQLVQMDRAQAIDMLRSAFHIGQLNQLRALERNQAALSNKRSSNPEPLESYEYHYHKAQVVEALLEGGTIFARQYLEQRDFRPADAQQLLDDAKAFIVAASQEQATNAKETAIARYNKLYQRCYENHDYKGAAMVQRCMDKLTGLDKQEAGRTSLEQGLLSIMQEVMREEPQAGGSLPATKPTLVVREISAGSNISDEHVVGN